ncbi:Rho GTPase-activating protein 36 [Myotis brandtii]|uniref:Rho GTPase-activating protein 36 n=1 Tax=Myotis brandtii TaxID=109478 RepID=S7PLK2_MYOBR|nr:Rho GTPase-activating protein 36 [Myotis brandtii]
MEMPLSPERQQMDRVNVLGGAPGHNPDRRTKMISIHSLSELERLKLQETAYHELVARHFLSEFKPERALPVDSPNTLENRFLILRGQQRGSSAASLKTFGIRLEEVLVNEFTRSKQLELRAAMQIEESISQAAGRRRRRGNVVQRMFGRIRRFFNRRREEPSLPREFTRRGRRGAVSVDSLAELEDGALLLQALQLSKISFPIGRRLLGSKRKMSLNPIAKQIPQVVEACCSFIEKHGLNTVGIFTLEYSEERVRELREEFDQGLDVVFDDTQNVHDVAALLKEFFRDMKDSLLPDDLYMSFLLTATLKPQDQLSALQLLVYLMPPCHSDTLERLLKALHKITENCEDSIGIDGQLVFGNRMTSTNLALVFGSALLKKGRFGKRESRKTNLGIDHYVASVNVVRAMIDNWDVLFQVPPHIQRQVAKRVWKSSPEALDFIRRRNLRRIQSARIKMEEDALLSDPVENSAEARAAVLAQSKPFDEDPEGVPDVQEIPNPGEIPNHDLEEGPNFEDYQNLVLAEVPYLHVIPNYEEASDTNEIPDHADASDDNENPDSEENPNLEEVPALDEIPNDEASNAEDISDHEETLEVNGISDFYEDLDFEDVPALHVVPSPEEAPDGHEIPNHEESPEVNGLSDSGEVPALDGVPNDEEISGTEEIPGHKEMPEVNGIAGPEEESNPEEVPALHVVTSPEDVSDFDDIQDEEESSKMSGVLNNEEASDAEEIPGHEEASDVSGIQDSEENSNFEEDSVLGVVPEPRDAQIHNEISGSQKYPDNTFEEDEVTNVIPEPKDVSIFSTIPDPQPDPAVNLEEIMNMEAVPMPNYLDSKEVQNPKAIQFYKEDANVTFPVDTTLLKNKSQTGQVMNYKPFPESLKIYSCFLPSMKCCSSEEPAVPPGTARSHDDEEGAGNPPILEQDRPLLRVPRDEAKTGIGYFFP